MDSTALDYIGSLGAGGIFAYLMLQTVLSFLRTRNGKNKLVVCELAGSQAEQLGKIHQWCFGASSGGMERPAEALRELQSLLKEQIKTMNDLIAELKRRPCIVGDDHR